jgi:hypothetical protein
MATPFPAWVAAGTSLITIILTISFNAFLWLDFTRAILGAFTFHEQFSVPRCFYVADSSPLRRAGGWKREKRNETAPRFPARLFSLQVTILLVYSRSLFREVSKYGRYEITQSVCFHCVTLVSSFSVTLSPPYRSRHRIYKVLS